ncbi:MAG TPA: AraC family transcriptional regulator [Pontiellaceae bacterium]|nr:AraC family transcriptional regulator [Pontiellaceae bacterium]
MNEIISYGRFRCKELAPHKNRGMEITYIEKGVLEWMVEGVPEKIEPGSVFFTLPWQVHGSLHPSEPDNVVWHVLFHLDEDYPAPRRQFGFPPGFGFSPIEMKMLSTAFTSGSKHCFRATPAMHWLMPALINELQTTHELAKAHSISLLRAVLVELKRIVSGDAVDTDTHTWSEKKVQALLTDLSSSCDQQWTLKQMAGRCGIRRTRLNTVFQKLTGSTPMEYLTRLRMERAKTLLRETGIKIIDIAFECGFGSSQYFANTFKQATGMTPTGYRIHCARLTTDELLKWKNVKFRSEQEERRRVQNFSAN